MATRRVLEAVHEDAAPYGSDAEFEDAAEYVSSEDNSAGGTSQPTLPSSSDGDGGEGLHDALELVVEDLLQSSGEGDDVDQEDEQSGEEGHQESQDLESAEDAESDGDGNGDDEEEEEDDEEYVVPMTRHRVLSLLFGRAERGGRRPTGLAKLGEQPVQPLQGDLAKQLNANTRAWDVGQTNIIWTCMDAGFDASAVPLISTEKHRRLLHEQQQPGHPVHKRQRTMQQQQQQQPASNAASSAAPGRLASMIESAAASITTRSAARRAAAGAAGRDEETTAAAAAGDADAASSSSSSSSSGTETGLMLLNTAQLLLKREVSLGRQTGFSRSQQRHLNCHRNFPLHPQQVRDNMHSRAYIGQYSASGDFFIAAYQDRRVRLYDTQRGWQLRKDVTTRMTRWTITDTCLSPDQRLLVYASISPVAFVVNVGSSYDLVESLANITELHEPLAFDGSHAAGANNTRAGRGGGYGSDNEPEWTARDFGIWSIAWSPQGGQLIAGTNDRSVYVYDIESKRCLTRLTGHQDDVNAVAYLHGSDSSANPHIVVSGSDDDMVRLWDVRDKAAGGGAGGGAVRKPQGVLVGHTEGLTHVCPKGDGVHLISNAKDQTIKLWDVRAAMSAADASDAARERPAIERWDYRWEEYPAAGYDVRHPRDRALMTYRGHQVLQTLVRAYFSPQHTTGQRYVYAGSSDGVIKAWDVVSGQPVVQFEYHRALVRDCSWHPYEPEFSSVSWDGRVVSWGVAPPEGQHMVCGERGDVGRFY